MTMRGLLPVTFAHLSGSCAYVIMSLLLLGLLMLLPPIAMAAEPARWVNTK